MTSAQVSWAALTALFLVGGVVTLVADVPYGGQASVFLLTVALTGWATLLAMILFNNRTVPTGE